MVSSSSKSKHWCEKRCQENRFEVLCAKGAGDSCKEVMKYVIPATVSFERACPDCRQPPLCCLVTVPRPAASLYGCHRASRVLPDRAWPAWSVYPSSWQGRYSGIDQ